ncbi:MAG: glutamate--tRNA ligase [Pseudomonadota bacterium]|nr:glutamate--tRNA ligase [Pseudomonadota bacterium]
MPKNTIGKVRTRFAPSPTGYLHVGGARTALYSYLYAKHTGGEYVLRVEDTDQVRSTEDALKMQVEDLLWLGLNWDEGPDPKTLKDLGSFAPYRQSQRLEIYKKYSDQILAQGKAFYCFCTDEDLERKRQKAMKEGRPPHYDGTCRKIDIETAKQKISRGEKGAVRFLVTHTHDVKFNDLIRGEVVFPPGMLGDFILLRSDGMPVYNFCCTIDDALMEITHVLRAEEHLSNTLRQLLIYEALGFEIPIFGHLSIILGADRQKLSKRHGDTSCHEYKEKGYLPEAIKNYIALLGWSSPKGQEIFTESELIEQFDLDRLNPAAAVFDEVKLKWVNAQYIRTMPHAELWQKLLPFFDGAGLKLPSDIEWQDKAIGLMKTSMETLVDAVELFRPLSLTELDLNDEGKEVLKWETSFKVITKWREKIEGCGKMYLSTAEFDAIINSVKDECNVKGKFLFMPTRVAIIGKPHGAELKQLVPLLSKDVLVARANRCLKI